MDWNRTVFLHTGWTKHYNGNETPEGGHSYLENSEDGAEKSNFMETDDFCFGYAPVRKNENTRTIKISRLGKTNKQDFIENINVVWTAKNPNNKSVIVGVYHNAILYRNLQSNPTLHIAKVRKEDAHLIDLRLRDFKLIRGKKGYQGQASAWFPAKSKATEIKEYLQKIEEYLDKVTDKQLVV